jgi:hypothetical protein
MQGGFRLSVLGRDHVGLDSRASKLTRGCACEAHNALCSSLGVGHDVNEVAELGHQNSGDFLSLRDDDRVR